MRAIVLLLLLISLGLTGCGKDPERLGTMAIKVANRVESATKSLKTRLTAQALLFPGFVENLDLSHKVRVRILLDSRLTGCDIHTQVLEGDVVELTGTLTSEKVRPMLLQSVETIPGVKGVADATKVTPPTTP
jgi:osmotically-inducible protein OsmY